MLVAADVLALTALRPDAAAAVSQLPHIDRWIARTGTDRALAQLAEAAVWLAACWAALGLLAAFGAALPGLPGRFSARVCRAVLPKAARRLVAGTAGLGVLLAPAAALAAPTQAAQVAASATVRHTPGNPLPAPVWPTSPSEHPHHRDPAPHSAPVAKTVRVRPGDCLWLIAARHLPTHASDAEIAAYWPRWYAANRGAIGSDPDVLRPGEVLHIPAPPPHSTNGGPR